MITIVTGKIGGGKTLFTVGKMMAHLAKGGRVMGNIRINFDQAASYCWKKYRARIQECQIAYHNFEEMPVFYHSTEFMRGTDELPMMLVCDECQIYFPANEKRPYYKALLDFLTLSRRFNVDIYFITQDPTTFVPAFRNQSQFTFYCADMRQQTVGFFGQISMLGLRWSQRDTKTGVLNTRGTTKLSKDIFSCYDTRQSYSSDTHALKESTRVFQPVNVKKKVKKK